MKYLRIISILILVALGGYFVGRRHVDHPIAAASARKILYYACPMHPQYRSDHPGAAPCCGMQLEPVYADNQTAAAPSAPPGALHVSPEKQQLIGVRYEPAQIAPATQVIRAGAKVAYDMRETVLVADVYEYEATAIQLGQRAWVTRPYPPRRSFWATVDFLYPRLDPPCRTLVASTPGTSGVKLIPDTCSMSNSRFPEPKPLPFPPKPFSIQACAKSSSSISARVMWMFAKWKPDGACVSGSRSPEASNPASASLWPARSFWIRRARIRMPARLDARHPTPQPSATPAHGIDQPSSADYRDASRMVTESNPLQTGETVQQIPSAAWRWIP